MRSKGIGMSNRVTFPMRNSNRLRDRGSLDELTAGVDLLAIINDWWAFWYTNHHMLEAIFGLPERYPYPAATIFGNVACGSPEPKAYRSARVVKRSLSGVDGSSGHRSRS